MADINQVSVKGTVYDIADETVRSELADSLAIVANGNTHVAIGAGQFVYVRNHSSLANGLYTAKSAISANATLSTSNLEADSQGGLNALNSNFSWKSLTPTTGAEHMTLPDALTAKEFIFIARYGTSSGFQQMSFTFHIPNVTTINGLTPTQGYYLSNGNAFCQISVNCVSHVALISQLVINGTNCTSTSQLICFYR